MADMTIPSSTMSSSLLRQAQAEDKPVSTDKPVRNRTVPEDESSIKCEGGNLVVQNRDQSSFSPCVEAHEASHAQDWKDRYGPNLCVGVPDGKLPMGGPGYKEFHKQSECGAYQASMKCTEDKMKDATGEERQRLKDLVDLQFVYSRANGCP